MFSDTTIAAILVLTIVLTLGIVMIPAIVALARGRAEKYKILIINVIQAIIYFFSINADNRAVMIIGLIISTVIWTAALIKAVKKD